MYKSEQILNLFYSISLRNYLALISVISLYNTSYGQSGDFFQEKRSDTIVVITTKAYKEIRGVLVEENQKLILIEVSNQEKVFMKDDIISYKYITRNEIKNISEFKNPNPIFTKYCYMPSAFINKEKTISTNSHYFVTTNSKIGLHENFEISIGNISISNIYSSATYSKKINESFSGAISVIGNYNLLSGTIGDNSFNGIGVIPRITFGGEYRNTTVGFIGCQLPIIESFFYGGYFGSQKKISERFTIAGETIGLTTDGFQYIILTNLIVNFYRNLRENWSVGLTLIGTNNINFGVPSNGLNNSEIYPLPYVGIQRNF